MAAFAWMIAPLCLSTAMAPRPATPPVPPPAPAAAASSRTEILTYDNWTVTCHDNRDAKERRLCTGELHIFQEAPDKTRRAVFSWLIGQNREGQVAMAFRFPSGVAIQPGVELKLGDKPVRRVPITICEPTVCEASQLLDDAFLRDASAVAQVDAMIVASDGRQVTFTIYPKGLAQAVAAIRK